jgi:hypothetical protein
MIRSEAPSPFSPSPLEDEGNGRREGNPLTLILSLGGARKVEERWKKKEVLSGFLLEYHKNILNNSDNKTIIQVSIESYAALPGYRSHLTKNH